VIALDSEVPTTMKPDSIHCVLVVPNGPTPPPFQAIEIDDTTSKLVGINNLTPSSESIVISYVSIITTSRIPQIITTIWLLWVLPSLQSIS